MNKTVFSLFFALVCAVATVPAQNVLCFENKGLKAINRISFELKGSKIVEGYFETMGYDNSTSAETFEFSGTKTGTQLKIKFAGTIPYERPPGTKTIVWTFAKNVLKVPTYGKDYQTNKYAIYPAAYEKCSDN